MRFEGKVAIVTGAASGIGAATARRLAADGAHVVLADTDEQGLTEVASSIGVTALSVPMDVTSQQDNERLVQTALSSFGRVDAVHLNAGIAQFASIFDCTIEQWDRHMAVNLTGVFLGLQASAPALVESGGGAVLVTSSTAGRRGTPSAVAYVASKHGVLGLVKAASVDLAPHNIRINGICPGVVETPLMGPARESPEGLKLLASMQVLRRYAQPEELAAFAAFLLSDEASYMTGEVITVDGGVANLMNTSLAADFVTSITD